MSEKLSDTARKSLLEPLFAKDWKMVEGRDAITKTFVFQDFIAAFGFMTRSALYCEKWNHHPEWSNVYKTVEVTLCTHDVDGLSSLDAKLARKMDQLAES